MLMKRSWFAPTSLLTGICLTVLMVVGCERTRSNAVSVRDQLAQPPSSPTTEQNAATPPVTRSTSGRPLASINGEPIDRAEFTAKLMEARGLAFLQQEVLLRLARQETARLGLSVSQTDFDREYDLTLQADRFNGKDPDPLTPPRKEQLVEDWTRSRGISRTELDIAMQRQAYLRKVAESRLKITDEMIEQEFARVHGERVEVRHIQIAAPRFWKEIKQRLDQGERFEDLVMKFSQNIISREKLGMLPPFSRTDPTVPSIFVDVAFKLKPGEISNLLEAEGSYHVLKLERLIPADSAPLDDAERHHLRRTLTARLAAEEMERLGRSLLLSARISVEDRVLREQYEARHREGRLTGPPLSP